MAFAQVADARADEHGASLVGLTHQGLEPRLALQRLDGYPHSKLDVVSHLASKPRDVGLAVALSNPGRVVIEREIRIANGEKASAKLRPGARRKGGPPPSYELLEAHEMAGAGRNYGP